ncbi:MAG: hypothetical protein CM1200mP10_06990 [Candidatus Neomarinimicrobiota bacterium]|nr:MAG: hypothetical protein CM1200mP10_06990 [Candidatus Neomarinimicrobiota bacterium]
MESLPGPYLYRKMIPIIVGAGHRVVVPDLVGFGKSESQLTKKITLIKNM